MEPLLAGEIAELTQATLFSGDPGSRVTGVSTDSRTLAPGDLFVAIRGDRFDGYRFVGTALERGASAVLCSAPVEAPGGAAVLVAESPVAALGRLAAGYRRRFTLSVVAITGSVGKTTAKDVVGHVLGMDYRTVASPKSFNNSIGVPLTLLEIDSSVKAAVLELGASAKGEIRALAEMVGPEVGIVTAVREAHLEGFGSLDAVREAKGELLGAVQGKTAILNADDPATGHYRKEFQGRCLTFGQAEGADVRICRVVEHEAGLAYRFRVAGRIVEGRVGLVGRHQIGAVAAGFAVAKVYGIDLEKVANGLASFEAAPGRLRRVLAGPVVLYDDSYNASPASVREAISFLYRRATGRRGVLVLGDMLELGLHAEALHAQIGRELAQRPAAVVIAVGELAGIVAREASRRAPEAIRTVHASDADFATRIAAKLVEPGDCVLVKGSRALGLDRVVSALHRLFRKEEKTLRLEGAMS